MYYSYLSVLKDNLSVGEQYFDEKKNRDDWEEYHVDQPTTEINQTLYWLKIFLKSYLNYDIKSYKTFSY